MRSERGRGARHNVPLERDSLYPRDFAAFRRALVPALRLCGSSGDASRTPMAYFAVLMARSEPDQAKLMPHVPPRAEDVDEEGRVSLCWLVSADSEDAFTSWRDDYFDDCIGELNDVLPYGLRMDEAPETHTEYGVMPRECAGFLAVMHQAAYDETGIQGCIHVQLRGAAAAAKKKARQE
jgi:hypothetical protein